VPRCRFSLCLSAGVSHQKTVMKAWLLTWEWIGDHARVRDPFVAILSSRKSDRSVAEFVEYYYLLMTSSAKEIASFVNRPKNIPYKAERTVQINDVPHGDRITCGHNPFVYARKVSDLVVAHIHDQTVESIKWKEPPIFKWEDRNRLKIARAQDGEHKELIRRLTYPINDILSSSLSVSGEFHNG
jgi:hypothetical protein